MIFKCKRCGSLIEEPLIRMTRARHKVKRGKGRFTRIMKGTPRVKYVHRPYNSKFEIRCKKCGFATEVVKKR